MSAQWHPITEIPPIDTDRTSLARGAVSAWLLLYGVNDHYSDEHYQIGYYAHDLRSFYFYDKRADRYSNYGFTITHWCDLPTPPEVVS